MSGMRRMTSNRAMVLRLEVPRHVVHLLGNHAGAQHDAERTLSLKRPVMPRLRE
jgi:hypothetical protein